ncbi:AI-2E family transporter [Bradyrhizobium rifense]|uniref:AI-2E family transporter n=2 Tax=Bradyrhizobium rifense TaxID=515499 RepID=A0A5D3KUI0_9BRAD|nr:AI-2E family transporter [Bradyrhizobium rifense]
MGPPMPRHDFVRSDDGSGFRTLEEPPPQFESHMRATIQAAIAVAVMLLALWVARDFLVAMIWAGVIAITTWPFYVRFAQLISGRPSSLLASLLFTCIIGLVLLIPIVLTVRQVAQGSDAFVHVLNSLRESGVVVPGWLVQLPIAGEYLDLWWRANLSNPEALKEWLRGVNIENLTSWTGTLGGALLHRLFLFAITLIALFLMLRDGIWLADRSVVTARRLLGNPGTRLVGKIAAATRATVNGTIAAAIVKGAVVGIAYVVMGVPHPLLFSAMTIVLAMVPLGAWVVLAAASLTLVVQDGILLVPVGLFVFGAAVLLIGDNFIQPALIGGSAELPFLLVLIGILGGMQSFGLVGLFLGPVIMAALLTVWREWIGIRE